MTGHTSPDFERPVEPPVLQEPPRRPHRLLSVIGLSAVLVGVGYLATLSNAPSALRDGEELGPHNAEAARGLLPDEIWRKAVERTGGRFFAAADEATILEAVHEIDVNARRIGRDFQVIGQHAANVARRATHL